MWKVIRTAWIALIPLVLCPAQATAEWEINWIKGTVGPESWTIAPLYPTTKDIIHFSGHTGIYSNSCFAVCDMGRPNLTVDVSRHRIGLWFKYVPPGPCALEYDPVCGLEGQFGPLESGDWLFFSAHGDVAFYLPFQVSEAEYFLTVNAVAGAW